MVHQGDVAIIRFWLSLFGLYRVIEFKGALKLKTITDPGKDISQFRKDIWSVWVPKFFAKAALQTASSWEMDPTFALTPWSIPFMRKAAPNSGGLPSVSALAVDLLLFASDPEMLALLRKWLKAVDGLDLLWVINPIIEVLDLRASLYADKLATQWRSGDYACAGLFASLGVFVSDDPSESFRRVDGGEFHPIGFYKAMVWSNLSFGKLGFKEEPGKIRVFAMVNSITQTLMYPLHKWIFDRLRLLATDGTFNQAAPVERLIKGFKKEGQFVASYDLSAATDRLPLLLQTDLLAHLMGDTLAQIWAKLLVGRSYSLPRIAKSYNLGFSEVSYAVGQPMGALSSWALLALTHHALVQLAASRALPKHGQEWFMGYAVLGDDIVIANKLVAAEYLRIMDTIGVEVGLSKSMISTTGSLEFAKRTYIRGRHCSPVSLAELLVALCNLGALDQLVRKCDTFRKLKVSSVARFAGFGYKNLGRLPICLSLNNRLSSLIAYLCRPGGVWPMPVEAWLVAVGPGRHGAAEAQRLWATAQSLWDRIVGALIQRNVRFERTLYQANHVRYSDATHRVQKTVELPNGRKVRQSKDKAVFGPVARELLALDSHSVQWNSFFTEWVAYPYCSRLRKAFEKIDDVLRVLHPHVLPEWSSLDEIWTQVFEADEGQSALPTRVDYFTRETDEAAPSTRLVTLWRKLRTVVSHREKPIFQPSNTIIWGPKPHRRRRGG
jgi:hypothetical protein